MVTVTFDEKTDLGKSLITLIHSIQQTDKKLFTINLQNLAVSAPEKKTTDFSKWFGIWKNEANETFDRKKLWRSEQNIW